MMPTKAPKPFGVRLLLLGHEPSVETELAAVLEAQGCEVFVAASPRQATELLRAGDIDVAVLDFDNHSVDSRQLMAKLRRGNQRCRLLVLTRSLEQLALATEIAADAVLMKPLDLPRIATLVNHLASGLSLQVPAPHWATGSVAAGSETPAPLRHWGMNE